MARMVVFCFLTKMLRGFSALFQEVYVQLFFDSLCPDKTFILNTAELTSTLLGQWFRYTGDTVQQDQQHRCATCSSKARVLSCVTLPKQQIDDMQRYQSTKVNLALAALRSE